MEEQVLVYLNKESVLNIQGYFDESNHTLFDMAPPEWRARYMDYKASLQRKNQEKFPLKNPKDMPAEAKEIVDQLKYYEKAFYSGENPEIAQSNFLLKNNHQKIDFWNFHEELNFQPKIPQDNKKLKDILDLNVYNGVYRLGNYGSHLVVSEVASYDIDTVRAVDQVYSFYRYLSDKKCDFLYVQLPNKLSPDTSTLPKNCNNTRNEDATKVLRGLEEKEIPFLDYRASMIGNNINFLDSFFRTDHHWKQRTSFYAAKEICGRLAQLIGLDIDQTVFDLSNYNCRTYPDILLGNWGIMTGLLYAGLDDFELMTPTYETDYSWIIPTKYVNKRGPMEESLLYPLHVDWGYFYLGPYGSTSLDERQYSKIINHKNKNGLKALLLRDSFTGPMVTFLAPHFSELHLFDLRGTLTKCDVLRSIDEVKPDVVLMMHWPGNVGGFSFFNPYT